MAQGPRRRRAGEEDRRALPGLRLDSYARAGRADALDTGTGQGMIEDSVIAAMATGLAREYGLVRAAATATDRALAELDQGHVGVARTWRRILNALKWTGGGLMSSL